MDDDRTAISDKKWLRELKDQPRDYQLDLLDAALEENTIVNLGTGAGKTFIAVMLIRELQHQIQGPWPVYKRTLFIVTSVPLVEQQASYIEKHLSVTVGRYKGDMNVDNWDRSRWSTEFQNNHVLVMTAQILLNILNHFSRDFPLSMINLLIIDECHHCTKNHPYHEITRLFANYEEEECPRVLGLTASILKGKTKPHQIEKAIKELEQNMRCRCQTTKDLIQVDRFAALPKEFIVVFDSTPSRRVGMVTRIIDEVLENVVEFGKEQKRQCGDAYQLCKVLLEDVSYTVKSLGPTQAQKVAEENLQTSRLYQSIMGIAPMGRHLLDTVSTTVQTFLTQLQVQDYPPLVITPKVNKLLHCLEDFGIGSGESVKGGGTGEGEKLCGIVFVQRRSTAVRLCELITQIREHQEGLAFIKCDYIVGHGAGGALAKDTVMKSTKQEGVLERFRKKRINLLIATSVVEEGLDIPHCNFVVRFDLPNDIRAFIQSKGRARSSVSKFILLVDKQQERDERAMVENFIAMERTLRDCAVKERRVPDEDEMREAAMDDLPPYQPYGPKEATATLTSSLQLLHMYCQKLPHDSYTKPIPVFSVRKVPKFSFAQPLWQPRLLEEEQESHTACYECTIALPLPCPQREPIKGPQMKTRHRAKQAAALEAVKVLHKIGQLNRVLLPVVPEVGVGQREELQQLKEEKDARTEKRKAEYEHHVPMILSTCLPAAGQPCFLYAFHLKSVTESGYYQPGGRPSGADEGVLTFGIISGAKLPVSKVPPFSLYIRSIELAVSVEEHRVEFTESELSTLSEAHCYIVEEVLGVQSPQLKYSPDRAPVNYLVVPVRLIPSLPITFVDTKLAGTLADAKKGNTHVIKWRSGQDPSLYQGRIVTRTYTEQQDVQMFAVQKVDPAVTPCSPFPDPSQADSYLQYFHKKYHVLVEDRTQPALVCRFLSKRTELLTSRFKTRKGEDYEQGKDDAKDRQTVLFPELCRVFPIDASVYMILHCVPSVLYRLEAALTAEELRREIQCETGVGLLARGAEVVVETDLRGFGDRDISSMGCTVVMGDGTRIPVEDRRSLAENGVMAPVGPSTAIVMQALTLKAAEDVFDLERLEILGDSFLKLASSVSLFCIPKYHNEGQLTAARVRIISNLNLFHQAEKKQLPPLIFSRAFRAKETWVPPCYCVVTPTDHSKGPAPSKYTHKSVADKSVADCVEGLIGAYLSCGGMKAALSFMHWAGIELQTAQEDASGAQSVEVGGGHYHGGIPHNVRSRSQHCSEPAPTDLFQLLTSSRDVLPAMFTEWELPLLSDSQRQRLEQLQADLCNEVEHALGYRFKEKYYLIEAVTHSSYTKNSVTNCYQKLEFLGDAVLDYLITTYTYWKFPVRSPGELTLLRSALVNNNTFAEMSLKLRLDRLLKHNSPVLFNEITQCHTRRESDTLRSEGGQVLASMVAVSDDEEEDAEEIVAPKVLGDILESIAGAVFIDSGMDLRTVWDKFQPHFEPLIAKYSEHLPLTPVEQLLQMEPSARFEKLQKSGGAQGGYSVTARVPGGQGQGESPIIVHDHGNTRSAAKQNAAKKALKLLQDRKGSS